MKEAIASQRQEGFEFSDIFYFAKKGLEAIVEDQVTQRFISEEPVRWNLLTRTSINYQYLNWKLTLVWFFGVLFRYLFLLPFRWVKPYKIKCFVFYSLAKDPSLEIGIWGA